MLKYNFYGQSLGEVQKACLFTSIKRRGTFVGVIAHKGYKTLKTRIFWRSFQRRPADRFRGINALFVDSVNSLFAFYAFDILLVGGWVVIIMQ
jgi:hypothetical protein